MKIRFDAKMKFFKSKNGILRNRILTSSPCGLGLVVTYWGWMSGLGRDSDRWVGVGEMDEMVVVLIDSGSGGGRVRGLEI